MSIGALAVRLTGGGKQMRYMLLIYPEDQALGKTTAQSPLPWGEGGRRPGEGSAAWGDPTLAVMRLLATSTVVSDRGEVVGNARL